MTIKQYYVYILATRKDGILYIGVTNNLLKRVYEHKNNIVKGFTEKYKVHNLVYYETYDNICDAITREKRMKKWKRGWKIELIEKSNSQWRDLYNDITI
jgi:putative endonuclease